MASGKEFVLPLGCLHPQSISLQLAPHSAGDCLKFREAGLQSRISAFKSLSIQDYIGEETRYTFTP